jgi:hypothetical protein
MQAAFIVTGLHRRQPLACSCLDNMLRPDAVHHGSLCCCPCCCCAMQYYMHSRSASTSSDRRSSMATLEATQELPNSMQHNNTALVSDLTAKASCIVCFGAQCHTNLQYPQVAEQGIVCLAQQGIVCLTVLPFMECCAQQCTICACGCCCIRCWLLYLLYASVLQQAGLAS